MAYEFKKLSDVAAVETPADTANVLIEEGGVIKKVAKDEVGGVKVDTAKVGQTIVVKSVDENGKPTEWECADKGGQVDWNQNDPTALDYVKNKPFYEAENKTYMQEQVIITLDSNGYGTYELDSYLACMKTYIIVWDGVEYETTIGNNNDADDCADIEINGERLRIVNSYSFQGTASMAGNHTIEVYTKETNIKPIDEKYLPQPDMVITVNELIEYDTKPSLSNVFVERGTFKVLHDLILAGTAPNVVVRFYKNMNHIDEFWPVEATELKASVYWYGSAAVIRTVANDRNNRLICYKFVYEEGELTTIGMRYHEGTEV